MDSEINRGDLTPFVYGFMSIISDTFQDIIDILERKRTQLKKYEEKMTKTVDNLNSELATIRAGRANPHVLDKLTVDYYGSPTPIQQVANISVP